MEEKNVTKISLSTFLLIIAIIAIVIMGVFIYRLNNDKTAETVNSNTATETNTSSNKTTENNTTSNNNTKTGSNYSKEYERIIEKIENENTDVNLIYDLIYFNNDNIPDLVIDNLGYWVSLYIYENGTVHNPIDRWLYGAGGNTAYEYQAKKGLIRNYDSDFAGAIITESISVLNSDKKFDVLSNTKRGATSENDDITAIDEALTSYGGCYYNDNKITEQEYNNKLKELSIDINGTNFKRLSGSKSAQEIKNQL